MKKHNMTGMDEASKIFTSLPEVFSDLVDFALRKTGFRVVRGSLKERNPEVFARLPGMRRRYKKVCNDVAAELKVTDGDVTATMLVVLENQSRMSNVMAGRNLLATAAWWDAWRREMKRIHRAQKELKSPEEVLDGVLPTDRMAPIMPLVVHFGQEAWTGSLKFTDMLDCPPALKPMLAECPSNVISFYNMQEEELNEMPPGALRAVAKSICYAQHPEKLLHEWQTDPSFAPPWLDEMQDVIAIATGLDNKLLTEIKEEDMQQKVSAIEEYFVNKGIIIGEAKGEAKGRAEGEIKGKTEEEARIALRFIQNRRNRYLSEFQILEDLKSDLGLDEAKARQYMDAALANA